VLPHHTPLPLPRLSFFIASLPPSSPPLLFFFFFFFTATAPSEIYTLSLHDALPICPGKFLGVVLRLFLPEAGACPIPIQPLHPAWCIRPPADKRLAI